MFTCNELLKIKLQHSPRNSAAKSHHLMNQKPCRFVVEPTFQVEKNLAETSDSHASPSYRNWSPQPCRGRGSCLTNGELRYNFRRSILKNEQL